ncbi:SUKH-3 domain-containing protein [Cellulomonas sp. JZ18]|uniref:SUKH-3 domain-containing protein n=1 Tax=Cellulomonas sp. JZ18 TaxID=2654191 RepID=UPI002103E7D0|nr:SUKH-3 domain-containing protein [Cellulomonas sp. JZ18]
MSHGALELLSRAGWTPARRVAVDDLIARLRDDDHDVVPPYRDFMAQFSGLIVGSDDTDRTLDFEMDHVLVITGPGWCEAYGEEIGRLVTPVARHDSHMALLIDESGEFWGAYDDLFGYMGRDIVQVVERLLIDPPGTHELDRRLPD